MSWVRYYGPIRQLSSECRRMTIRSLTTLRNEEYTEVAQYPPIVVKDKKLEKKKQEEIPLELTVEEKQLKQNMNYYYGRNMISFNNTFMPYNGFGFVKHCTNTKFILGELPPQYGTLKVDDLVEKMQPLVEEAILLEYDILKSRGTFTNNLSPGQQEDILMNSIIQHINRIILNNCSNIDNISDIQIDLHPRHNFSWVVDGIEPPHIVRKSRLGLEWTKPLAEQPYLRGVQYLGSPHLAVRIRRPLTPLPHYVPEKIEPEVKENVYDPRVYGFTKVRQPMMTIPGYWAGDKYRFGLISYEKKQSEEISKSDPEAPHGHAVLSSFAWASAQAAFLQHPNATPLLTQTVLTNGKDFSVYIYQLGKHGNVCWGGISKPLYTEALSGRLVGFNPNTLTDLIKLYVNGKNCLTEDALPQAKTVSQLEDWEEREWIYKHHRHLLSGRKRHRLEPEIYHWEKIYKIDHKMRPLEPRRRPFELGVDPWKRKLNEWPNVYIPKKLRENPKLKFEKKHYPK